MSETSTEQLTQIAQFLHNMFNHIEIKKIKKKIWPFKILLC